MQPPIISTRQDGQVGAGVYVAYQRRCSTGEYVRMWIGTPRSGPVLEWDANATAMWDGIQRRDFIGGAWAICYSRGDYGRNCACGGNWSSHSINVAGLPSKTIETNTKVLLVDDQTMITAPDGIAHDVTIMHIEPKDGWAIWFATASEALAARLTPEQIQSAPLPRETKELLKKENLTALKEVLAAYKL